MASPTSPGARAPARHRATRRDARPVSRPVSRAVPPVVALVVALVVAGAVGAAALVVGGLPVTAPGRQSGGPPAAPAPSAAAGTTPAGPTGPREAAPRTTPEPARHRAAELLAVWDSARAAAWRAGDVGALRALYVAGAGRSDVRLLRSWLARGYRVEDMRTQLLAVRPLRHRPGEWTLRVTDRLTAAVAVGHGRRVPLPRDRADTRVVRLVRAADGGWRVARVRGARSS